jgi:predicted outer membrane repeat protein
MNALGDSSSSYTGSKGSAFRRPSYKRSMAILSASGIVFGLGFSGVNSSSATTPDECSGNEITPATSGTLAQRKLQNVLNIEQKLDVGDVDGIVCLNGDFALSEPVDFHRNARVYGIGDSSITSDSSVFSGLLNGTEWFDIVISNLSIVDSGGPAVLAGDVDVVDSIFSGNISTQYDGGAIYSSGDVTISSSRLSNNRARVGGAIHATRDVTISNSTLSDNYSLEDAGAISSGRDVSILNNSMFSGNESADNGGAIRANRDVTVSDSTLTDNSAALRAGAIYGDRDVTISNSTLSANESSNHGGAIFGIRTIRVTDSTLSGNAAGLDGGAIFADGDGDVTISGSILSGNRADRSGGALLSLGAVNVSNSSFSNNIADEDENNAGDGGAVYASGNLISLSNTFAGNSAVHGGAVHGSMDLTFENSPLSGNSAVSGGAIYGLGYSYTLSISDSTLTDNTATDEGGAVLILGSLIVSGSTMTGNSTQASGGALWVQRTSSIEDSTFSTNSADYSGGAIRGYGTITSTRSTFVNNTAYEGGAIYGFRDYGEGGRVEVSNSTFMTNQATRSGAEGGAINAYNGEVLFSTFVNNTASEPQGGDTPGDSIYKTGDGVFDIGANIFAGTSEHPQLGAGSSPRHFTDLGGNLFSTSSSDETDIAEDPELDPELQLKNETSVFSKSLLSLFGASTPTLRTFTPNSSGTQMLGLAAGSPALSIVPNSAPFTSFTQDQRGTTRTFPASAGAFQGVAPVEPTPTPTSTSTPTSTPASAPVALASTGTDNPFWFTLMAGLVTALGSIFVGVSYKLRRRMK